MVVIKEVKVEKFQNCNCGPLKNLLKCPKWTTGIKEPKVAKQVKKTFKAISEALYSVPKSTFMRENGQICT